MTDFLRAVKVVIATDVLIPRCRLLEGLTVVLARTKPHLDAVYRLRWQIYVEEGYIEPGRFPDQRLTDRYDENSLNLLALKHGTPVGTARLVLPSSKGLPTQNAFSLLGLDLPPSEVGEVSKVCIVRPCRNTSLGLRVFWALTGTIYRLCRAHGLKYFLSGMRRAMARMVETLPYCPVVRELLVGPVTPENERERETARLYLEKFRIVPYLVELFCLSPGGWQKQD